VVVGPARVAPTSSACTSALSRRFPPCSSNSPSVAWASATESPATALHRQAWSALSWWYPFQVSANDDRSDYPATCTLPANPSPFQPAMLRPSPAAPDPCRHPACPFRRVACTSVCVTEQGRCQKKLAP
jgi:hypothetical protein